jgi:hypothetical protein
MECQELAIAFGLKKLGAKTKETDIYSTGRYPFLLMNIDAILPEPTILIAGSGG